MANSQAACTLGRHQERLLKASLDRGARRAAAIKGEGEDEGEDEDGRGRKPLGSALGSARLAYSFLAARSAWRSTRSLERQRQKQTPLMSPM